MELRAACFLIDDENLGSLNQNGKVVVYAGQEDSSWVPEKELAIDFEDINKVSDLRSIMDDIVNFLGDIKLFIARSVTGIPYFALEKAGVEIWECEGSPKAVLGEITLEMLYPKIKCGSKDTDYHFLVGDSLMKEISKKIFTVVIKEIQGCSKGITSKQLIMPFLKKGEFERLEISCNHIPSWLELSLINFGYKMQMERKGINEIKVFITR